MNYTCVLHEPKEWPESFNGLKIVANTKGEARGQLKKKISGWVDGEPKKKWRQVKLPSLKLNRA